MEIIEFPFRRHSITIRIYINPYPICGSRESLPPQMRQTASGLLTIISPVPIYESGNADFDTGFGAESYRIYQISHV